MCRTLTDCGAHSENFTLKLKIWSGHCSCKSVRQLQYSERVSKVPVSETTPAAIQQEFCPQEDPKMQFTQEGKSTRSTCLTLFFRICYASIIFILCTSFLSEYFLMHDLSHTFCSKQVLFKRFFWIKFLRWAIFYCTWQQYAENNCFMLNSS